MECFCQCGQAFHTPRVATLPPNDAVWSAISPKPCGSSKRPTPSVRPVHDAMLPLSASTFWRDTWSSPTRTPPRLAVWAGSKEVPLVRPHSVRVAGGKSPAPRHARAGHGRASDVTPRRRPPPAARPRQPGGTRFSDTSRASARRVGTCHTCSRDPPTALTPLWRWLPPSPSRGPPTT